jgi:hypothetical protein
MCLVARVCSAMPCSDVVWCVHMSREDLDLVSYTEDLLSEIKTANRSNFLTHKTLNRRKKPNRVLWLPALGLGAAAVVIGGQRAGHGADRGRGGLLRCRSWRGQRRGGGGRADRAGLLLQMGGGHGSLRRRRWLPSVAAQPREKTALVASIAAALGDVKLGRGVLGGRRRRMRRAGLGTERVAGGN